MTQIQALNRATLPQPPSQGIQDFHLILLSANGTEVLNQFSAFKYNGLDREVACAVAPGGAVKTLTFTGFPHLVGCTGGEIVVFRLNDDNGWEDVFYGAVTQGWAAKKLPGGVRNYVADADYLLNGTVTDATAYPAQDPALIAQDLVRRLRHPALNFTELDFPPTGTALEGGFEQPGIPLGEALNLLSQSVTDSGRTVAYGVDARGSVFFKQLTGTLSVPYYPEDYTDLPINAADTVTAVLWVIGNEPSVPGAGRSYKPSTLTHLSVPDFGLHQIYGQTIALTSPSNVFVSKARVSYTQNGFTNPDSGSDSNPDGSGKLSSRATRTGTVPAGGGASIVYDIFPSYNAAKREYHVDGLPTYGIRINYQMNYDAIPPSNQSPPFLWFFWDAFAADGEQEILNTIMDLPVSNDAFSSRDYIFPPPAPWTRPETGETFYAPGTLRYCILLPGDVGTFYLADFRFLCLNTSLLDNAARAELRTPAQEPAQLVLRRGLERNRTGYYAPALPKVKLSNGQSSDAAEYRYAFDSTNGVSTVVDLGSPSREGDAALADRIRLAINTTTRESEVRTTIGRL